MCCQLHRVEIVQITLCALSTRLRWRSWGISVYIWRCRKMSSITIKTDWVEKILKKLSGENFKSAVKKFLTAAMIELGNQVTIEAPVWVSGILRKRKGYDVQIGDTRARMTAKLAYALRVHEWSSPHMPPVGEVWDKFSLAAWAKSKWINPRAVAHSIRKKWTKANPYMKRAAESTEPKLTWLAQKYVDQFLSA